MEAYFIRLAVKENVYIEASPVDYNTRWTTGRYQIDCPYGSGNTTDPQLCPFNKVPLVSITLNSKNYIAVSAYANGILINQQIYSQSTTSLNMYQVWDSCSDTGQCTIDFISQGVEIGSMVVDIDNNMKILRITSVPSSGFEVSKNDDANRCRVEQLTKSGISDFSQQNRQ